MTRALVLVAALAAALGLIDATRADPPSASELEGRHEAAVRAATLAWWLGVQEYPHDVLDRRDPARPREIEEIGRRSVERIARAMDTSGEGRILAVFNPLGFPDRPEIRWVRPADGAEVAFEVDLPAIGVVIHELRPAEADSAQVEPGGADIEPASVDSVVAAWRAQARDGSRPIVVPVDDPGEGPWGRTLCFLQIGTRDGPGHPLVDVEHVHKSRHGDRVVVRLVNRSSRPAEHVVVAPIAPIRSWQELGLDDQPIVAGDDVDLRGGALICDLDAGVRRAFALELAPPPPYRSFSPESR